LIYKYIIGQLQGQLPCVNDRYYRVSNNRSPNLIEIKSDFK
jgi:hypothetical protein